MDNLNSFGAVYKLFDITGEKEIRLATAIMPNGDVSVSVFRIGGSEKIEFVISKETLEDILKRIS